MEIVMSGIAKAFSTNQVLRDVSITLKEGEVHALMGENGAGKSTLMNILTGIHKADAGKITIDGVERTFPNPREAELNGVAFIHQAVSYTHLDVYKRQSKDKPRHACASCTAWLSAMKSGTKRSAAVNINAYS